MLIFGITNIFHLDQHLAQGANLIFFIPTCIVSIIMNLKNKKINLKNGIIVIICGIIGAIIGAKISIKLDVNLLRKYFGYFLFLIAINEFYSLFKLYKKNKKTDNKNNIKN